MKFIPASGRLEIGGRACTGLSPPDALADDICIDPSRALRRSSAFSQPLQRTVLAADTVESPQKRREPKAKARPFDPLSAACAAYALGRTRDGGEVQGNLVECGPLEPFEVHWTPFSWTTLKSRKHKPSTSQGS